MWRDVSPRQRRPQQSNTLSTYNTKSNVTGQSRIIGENTRSVTSLGENAGGRRQHHSYNNNSSDHYYVSAESFKRNNTPENINDFKNQNGSVRQSSSNGSTQLNYNNRQKQQFDYSNGPHKYSSAKYETYRKYGTKTANDLSDRDRRSPYINQNGRHEYFENKNLEKDKKNLNHDLKNQRSNNILIGEQNNLKREISPNTSNLNSSDKKIISGKNSIPVKRWVPPSLRPQHGVTQNDKTDAIFRKVRGILNKLTPEKFQKLSDDLLQIDLNSTVVLNGIILLIFEKALDEPKYSSMYAQLCKRLSKEAPNFDDPPSPSTCTFLRLLLNVCRDKFLSRSTSTFGNKSGISISEVYFDRDLKDGEIPTEEEEKHHVAKQRMLGNVKFIGELSKLQMLSENVLHKCIQSLLDKKQRPDSTLQDWCEDMECLCQLIKTCGKNLDTEQGKKLMKQYFETMDQRSKSKKYPPRIRFMLRDIIELRANNWVPRKVTATDGPVPIRDIRSDDTNVNRQPYVNHRSRDLHNNIHESDKWMNTLSLDIRSGYNNMLSFSLTNPSSIITQNYNSNKNRQHNQRNIQKNQNNRYNNRNQFNYLHYNTGMGATGINKNFLDNLNNKDLIPNFNRTLITTNQEPAENLQMRPAANSLLFKAGMNSKTPQMLPISTPPILSSHGPSQENVANLKTPILAPRSEAGGVTNSQVSSLNVNRSVYATATANTNLIAQSTESNLLTTGNSAKSSTTSLSNPSSNSLKDEKDKTLGIVITKHGSVEKRTSSGKIGKKDKGPNKEEFLKKVNTFLTENLILANEENDLKSMDEIVAAFVELKVPDKFMKDTCYTLLSEILDKSESQHARTIEFIQQLRKENKIQSSALLDGFKQIINKMSEKEATIPRVTTHVASLLSRGVSTKICNLSDIAAYTDGGQHYPLILLVLQQLQKTMSRDDLEDLFAASKVDLISCLPEADRNKDRLGEILEDRNLTFLYPLLKVQAEMLKQIEAEDNPQTFYKWIKANVDSKYHTNSGFINSLMTVILKYISQATILTDGADSKKYPDKSIIENEEAMLHKYCYILEKFLNGKIDLQLIAIYALQVYCFNLDFPKGMLCRWFKNLYEANVIEEDAFFRWKEEISDQYPGKGTALFQVNNWLTWLEQAESEDED